MELNQIVLYLERLANEIKTDHIDWGFRISALYGLDYRFTTTYGFLSDQLLKAQQLLRFRHADDLSRSLHSLRFSRHEPSASDESFPSRISKRSWRRNNLMASHSLLYGFDNYCQEGILRPRKLTISGRFNLAFSDGTDVALWQNDPGRQVTGTAMIQWTSPNTDGFDYAGDNNFNKRQVSVTTISSKSSDTWTHKFNDKIYTATEAWYMYMNDAIDHPTQEVPFQGGSFPGAERAMHRNGRC